MTLDSSTAILIASGLATAGWIYTGRRARTLAKKQHTINVMMQANFNKDFLTARAAIAPYLKQGDLPDDLLNGNQEELRASLRDILNHYEFLSAGLRNGDFDEQLLKDSERGTFLALFKSCERYIWHLRDGRNRMTIYEHLEWVHLRWTKDRHPSQRFIECIRGKPLYGRSERSDR